MLREYLRYHGYKNTLQCFQAETLQQRQPERLERHAPARWRDNMMKAFDSGEPRSVISIWERAVPRGVRDRDVAAQKIEFYLNIYFAIFPLLRRHGGHSGAGDSTAAIAMQDFKTFLDTRGAQLSRTAEFLPYYALPYVPNPAEHPTFRALFAKGWQSELRHRIYEFFSVTRGGADPPQLYTLLDHAHVEVTQELFGVAAEAIQALEHLRPERDGSTEAMQRRLHQIGERLSAMAIPEAEAAAVAAAPSTAHGREHQPHLGQSSRGSPTPQQLQQRVSGSVPLDNTNSLAVSLRPNTLAALDYTRIKDDLRSGSSDVARGLLLQALRWRISKAPAGRARRRALLIYIQFDLLGCAASGSKALMAELAGSATPWLVEQWARLINCAASECVGRSYLLRQEGLVKLLCDLLMREKADNVLRRNVLGALQKFSLRHKPQNDMIDAGMIEWIVGQLEEVDSLSDYSIEYGTALLMNLSLRQAGKLRAEQVPTLQVLNSLLEMDNVQVRTYVNGTLYSVLTRPLLKDQARAMGMEDILKYAMDHSDETFARQIQYILEQLMSDQVDDGQSDDENDEDEEVDEDPDEDEGDEEEGYEDEDEEEDHQDEAVAAEAANSPTGEELLCSKYLAPTPDALAEGARVDGALTAAATSTTTGGSNGLPLQVGLPLQRPTTPGHRRGPVDMTTPGSVRQADVVSAGTVGSLLPASAALAGVTEHGLAGPNRLATAGPEQEQEYEHAFVSRAKLARTPLAGSQRQPAMHG